MTTKQLSHGYTVRFATDARLVGPGNLAVGHVDSAGNNVSVTRVPTVVLEEFLEAVRDWVPKREED